MSEEDIVLMLDACGDEGTLDTVAYHRVAENKATTATGVETEKINGFRVTENCRTFLCDNYTKCKNKT